MQQLGASFGELTIAPPTPTEPLPPLPAEVDDAYIYPGEIIPQPAHIVPLITGFSTNVRIYQSYFPLSTIEMAFGTDELFDWDRQQRILEQCLQSCKQVLDSVPDVLKVLPQDSQNGRFGQRKQPYYPPMPEYLSVRDPALDAFQSGLDPAEARRTAQYEIQKANIYATQLSIRSYLAEKYFTLLDKHNLAKTQEALQDPLKDNSTDALALAAAMDRLVQSSGEQSDPERLENVMAAEKDQVVKELLVVLGSIDMVNMEPNGDSFVSGPFTPVCSSLATAMITQSLHLYLRRASVSSAIVIQHFDSPTYI
jgi:hypothetical protein